MLHLHINTIMHLFMTKCTLVTHCGRKSHLARFCYAKLSMLNKYI